MRLTVKRKKAKNMVLTGGCFDILHYGHIHFLKEAKKLGDYLIIALESDVNVKKLKGSGRPFHSQEKRREMLTSLTFVDEVIILPDKMADLDYKKIVLDIKPNVIAVTMGDPMLSKKIKHAQKIGAKVVEISRVDSTSTTQIAHLLQTERYP